MRYLVIALALAAIGCAPQQPPPEGAATGGSAAPGAVNKAAPPKPQPVTLTVPEGTVLRVRTNGTISTKTHTTGEKFDASLEAPIEEGGRILAPKGARVEGRVVESDPGGRVKGRASIAVRLTHLHLHGDEVVEIQTNSVARHARSSTKEDAAKIGIGAGVGAAIGAIAGGGKGAAIGAASGGGAGTGLVLATRGDPAVIPAESVLRFELRAPVTIRR
jgi:hypothetical protein